MKKYNKKEKLGSGAFGKVFRLQNKTTSEICAGKKITFDSPEDLDQVMNEIFIMLKLKHKHIVKVIDHFSEMKKQSSQWAVWLCTEYCEEGTLDHYFLKEGMERMTNKKLKITLMSQVADAVSYLHSQKVAHRDLKPRNILIAKGHGGAASVKVCDFGIAAAFASKTDMMYTKIGTQAFMAPEVIRCEKYTNACDIFSLGVILFALITGSCKDKYIIYLQNSVPLGIRMMDNPDAALLEVRKQLKSFPTSLRELVMSMLAEKPKYRYEAFTVSSELVSISLSYASTHDDDEEEEEDESDEDEEDEQNPFDFGFDYMSDDDYLSDEWDEYYM